MKGIDVSHWQGKNDWSKVGTSFAFMKGSQGTSFVDPRFEENKKNARKQGILCGFYHFADGIMKPEQEVEHFLETVGEILEGELLALDYEINIDNPDEWCYKFCKTVEERAGFKPLLYTNSGRVGLFDKTTTFPLWVARYD